MRRGSVGWLVGTMTANHLDSMANAVSTADVGDDTEFKFIISHALKYWAVSAKTLAEGVGVGEAQVRQWASGQVCNNHAALDDRARVMRWIESDLRGRAARMKEEVEKNN